MNVIFLRFDKNLDYKQVVNSFYIKKFIESAFGEFPVFVTRKDIDFDRDKLSEWVQKQYDLSKEYISETRTMPNAIETNYVSNCGIYDADLNLIDFEADFGLLDDHLVTVNDRDCVIGIICGEFDFDKIINEIK